MALFVSTEGTPATRTLNRSSWGILGCFLFYFGLEVCKVIRPISPKTCKFNTNNSTIFPYRSIYYCFIQGGLHIFRLIIFTMKEPVRAVMRNASHFCQPCACWWFRFADQEAHVLWKGTTSGSWSGGTSHFHSWKNSLLGWLSNFTRHCQCVSPERLFNGSLQLWLPAQRFNRFYWHNYSSKNYRVHSGNFVCC